MDLVQELDQLCTEFESEGVEYALCGGLAMAVYAFPRATLDIDVMVKPDALVRATEVSRGLGFDIDAGLMVLSDGDVQIHQLTKTAPDTAEALVLDMLLVTPAVEHVWESRTWVDWERGRISVVSPEGLISLKSLRGSGQDQDDIQHLRGLVDED